MLYEGLPNPWNEITVKQELQEKSTFEDHGFPFYTGQLDLKPEDGKRLTGMFADSASFIQFRGVKACGGFHPDYLVEWHVGDEVYRVHFCFGCHEVKVFGPKWTKA